MGAAGVATAAEAHSSENLRFAGKQTHGHLRHGRPVASTNEAAPPCCSIPSKFEAASSVNRSERKAFGCQTARFTDCVDALPGPGTYFSPTDLLRRNHGVGRKGYGALTSASKRWAGDAPRYTGPGPGEYSGGPRTHHWQPAYTANFAQGTDGHIACPRRADSPERALPGPGAYATAQAHHYTGARVDWVGAAHCGHASAFKSRERQLQLATAAGNPPPAAYNLCKEWGTDQRHAPQFKHYSSRTSPTPSAPPPDIIFPDKAPPASGRAPGPGAYDLQDAQSLRRKVASRLEKQSAAFAAADGRGAVAGPLKVAQAPGPGAYDTRVCALDPRRAVAAPFTSTAPKSTLLDERRFRDAPPGPAYYSPSRPAAKHSYHLNVRHAYV